MSRYGPAVLLLLVVLLSGCGGLASTDGTTPTETLTPASVPENTELAPGVSASDEGQPVVVSREQLLAADTAQRNRTSHRVTRTVVIEGPNWTTRIQRERLIAAGGSPMFERVDINSSGPLSPTISRSELWTNGSTAFVRTFDGTGNRIERGEFPAPPTHFNQWTVLRAQLLDGTDYRVESTADGVVIEVVAPPTLPTTVVPLSVREPRNVTASLTVTESGLIRSLRVRYDSTVEGDPVRVEIAHDVSDVGNTSVTRPEWV